MSFSIQRYIRRLYSSESNTITKDMKGNSETKIKQWLNEQSKKESIPNKSSNNSDIPSKNNKNDQTMQNNDMCIIL